jgi:TPR repeat protein
MAWLVKAAEAGNPQAQRVLGQSYAKGYGVERDPELARMWLKKSREGVSWHEDHDEAGRAGRHEEHAHHNDRDAAVKPKTDIHRWPP